MATERAGGLSTTAIEWCIDGWDEQRTGDGQAEKARAQLAALLADNAALRAALSGLLGGIERDDRPHAGQSLCRGLRTLDLVDEAIALVVAGAGPGAAGARDEIADLAVAFVRARDGADTTADDPEQDVADVDVAMVAYIGALDALATAVHRLDAPRAGGVGEGEAGDGGADGG
jgi:hypothetical protein